MFSKLQYISQGLTAKEQLENIQSALDAGCKWIQLRFKSANEKEFTEVAQQVRRICSSFNSTFIIDDHVEIAKSAEADGVHLGLQDVPVAQARTILGNNKIIGGTANTLNDVLMRINEKCDYIGLGPLRFTGTKEKLSPVLGLKNYEVIMDELSGRKIATPVYAVGGITADDIAPLMNAGVYGIAVSGAITNHSNKNELIQEYNSMLYEKIDIS